MTHTLQSIKNSMETVYPPSIILYGVEKIGKSTFGANMEKPIFVPTEPGIGNINCDTFPLCETYEQVLESLSELATNDHPYKTVVIDSLDWLEPLLWNYVCRINQSDSIEKVDGGYGKGYIAALDEWRKYFKYLDYLKTEKGMAILQIAHSKIKEVKSPDADIYDKFTMKLQDGKNTSAANLLFEYADMILFANHQTSTVKEKISKDLNRSRAIGTGQAVLYTREKPAFKAGNRYGLPETIPMDKEGKCWQSIKAFVPYYQQGAAV